MTPGTSTADVIIAIDKDRSELAISPTRRIFCMTLQQGLGLARSVVARHEGCLPVTATNAAAVRGLRWLGEVVLPVLHMHAGIDGEGFGSGDTSAGEGIFGLNGS
jgi:hypothetical protein